MHGFNAAILVAIALAGPMYSSSPAAQRPVVPTADSTVAEALAYLRTSEPDTINDQVALCEIPAPPFGEEVRAAAYRDRFAALGLANTRIDEEGNVLGEIGSGEPLVVLSAHLDTVFPAGTDVAVRREGATLAGPGIGDDCRGLAVVLAVARTMTRFAIEPAGTIVFVGTVGEEGPGDLRGVKALFDDTLAGRIDHFISVDGAGRSITHAAVGSNRYEVTFSGPGGHSYGDFGMPNPIHALGRAIAKLADLQVPSDPKTTFSVGLVEGGTSVNSIAFATTMTVDLRSESADALAELDAAFHRAVYDALAEESARWQSDVELSVDIVSIGVRPAGEQPETAPIVQAALAAAEELGFEAPTGASSTDANIAISRRIPAIAIDGGGRGRGSHSLEESFDTTDSHVGTQWALLVALTLAGQEGALALDAQGRLFVLDNGNHRVAVFDAASGAYRFAIGREGEGPGEFASPERIAIAGDQLVVADNTKLSYWNLDGEHHRDVSVRPIRLADALAAFSDSSLVIRLPERSGDDRMLVLARVDGDGEELTRYSASQRRRGRPVHPRLHPSGIVAGKSRAEPSQSTGRLRLAQRRRRIHAGGAARRDPRGERRDGEQRRGDGAKGQRIGGGDAEQHALHPAGERQRRGAADGDAGERQLQCAPQHQPAEGPDRGADRPADADLARLPGNGEREDAVEAERGEGRRE